MNIIFNQQLPRQTNIISPAFTNASALANIITNIQETINFLNEDCFLLNDATSIETQTDYSHMLRQVTMLSGSV